MIVKLGKQILVIQEVLPQGDAFEYYLLYDPNWETVFAKERREKDGKAGRKSTRSG
jgi:hypothetical protein